MLRREFVLSSFAAALSAGAAPLKIGHRQASMDVKPGPDVFDVGKRIPGLSGVELQCHFKGTTLWDRETLEAYKSGAKKAGLEIPSLAGVWTGGVSILKTGPAEEQLRKSIQAAEAIGARVILVAFFKQNCPNMEDEASYGPVAALLQKVAPMASGAGITLGLETSLSPAHDAKLVDLVKHPAVKVYFDAFNCEDFGHKGEAVGGYAKLGRARIAQVHAKNGNRLLEEPGPVDWKAALAALRKTGYSGWIVFESAHDGSDQCVEATKKNIEFIRRHWA
jgi:sugar phosphate isomerase/epimerase